MKTRLKLALVETGRTQRAIAQAIGLSENQLSTIVREVREARPHERRALAQMLGRTEAELFQD